MLLCCCGCRNSFSLCYSPLPVIVNLSGCGVISSIPSRLGFSQPYHLRGNQNCSVDWSNRTSHTKLLCDSLSGWGLFEHLNVAEDWKGEAHTKHWGCDCLTLQLTYDFFWNAHLLVQRGPSGYLALLSNLSNIVFATFGGTLGRQLKLTGNVPSQRTAPKYLPAQWLKHQLCFSFALFF